MTEADPTVNRLRREIRDEIGADTIEVRQSIDTPLQIRRRLADNRIVAMLVDRHYGRDRVPVTLFGRRAFFLRTPFVMGLITGAPVLPCSVERLGPGRFALRPGTPIDVSRDVPRDEAIARRRAAGRDDARGAYPHPSGALVSLLPLLERAARRLRRPRLSWDPGPWTRCHTSRSAGR